MLCAAFFSSWVFAIVTTLNQPSFIVFSLGPDPALGKTYFWKKLRSWKDNPGKWVESKSVLSKWSG